MNKSKNDNGPDFSYELDCGGECVAGIDEAGRGPLAGPVVAAAVVLPTDFPLETGLNDSKKLNEKKRDALFDLISETALSIGVGIVDCERIDKINILQATQEAMHSAVRQLKSQPDALLIDGNYFIDMGIPYKTIVKGDGKSLSIAAASIIAKVTRDRIMIEADAEYPGYSFASHKGYGTKKHYAAIDELGVCPIHRHSFLKKYFYREPELF